MTKVWKWFLAILGSIVLTLNGLLWDALIHSHEHGHAAEEALFNMSNPGHVVFGLGLIATAIVTLSACTVSWLRIHPGEEGGWRRLTVPLALWLGVGLMGAITLAVMAQA